MSGTLKCTLCGLDDIGIDEIDAHFGLYHREAQLAHWPDGELVVVNLDELEDTDG